ncbi:MAG TPA: hypothetical protein VH560_13735 [Polyangia bacterium]|nr:hypothetical protein [Polyangia bacterium]
MKASKLNVVGHAPMIARLVALVALVCGAAGCPIQTPAVDLGSASQLGVTASSASPLVGETITLSVTPPAGSTVDPATAVWATKDGTIVTLGSTAGSTIMVTADLVGTATVTVTAGGLSGSVTITVLAAAAANVDLVGPTSMSLGDVKTYLATVVDGDDNAIVATVAWVAKGSVALATPGANTGSSMRISAVSPGPGIVAAAAGGRTSSIAVMVTSTNGQLVIAQEDGTPFPSMLAFGQALTAKASLKSTAGSSDANAQWTSTGTCTLIGSSGATVSVEATTVGSCTVTAAANGMSANVTFTISNITGVTITGGTSPVVLGATRTYTASVMAGGVAVPGVTIQWTTVGPSVMTITPSGNQVAVTGTAVGAEMLVATVQGMSNASQVVTVEPASMQLQATSTRLLSGTGATVTVTPLTSAGLAAKFATPIGTTLAGATGFTTVSVPVLTAAGLVTFSLSGANADSPAVTALFGDISSNALAFSLASVASVAIQGPDGPVRVGSSVDLTAIIKDAAGMPIAGSVQVMWADPTGVYVLPEATNTTMVTANVAKIGTASITATVMGVVSPVFTSPSVPNSITVTAPTPGTVAVNGTATSVVTVLDANGAAVPGIPLSQMSLMSADGTKVSVDAGVVMGSGFLFTATGLAAAPAPGIGLTATWSDGVNDVMSGQVFLIVSGP